MQPLDTIIVQVTDGWQVQSVWLVPPSSHLGPPDRWVAQIKRADMVPLGEGDADLTLEVGPLPFGVSIVGREKVRDVEVPLAPMSDEQAHAIALDIARHGDASAVHKTTSGCWAIGPCAAWCRNPLRAAILGARK